MATPFRRFTRTLGLIAVGLTLVAPMAAKSAVTLRMGSEEPFSDPPRVAAQYGLDWLAKNVGARTQDEVRIRVSGNAALGPEKELLKSVASGVVDGCVATTGNVAALVPELQLFSVSYLFKDFDHAIRLLKNDAFFERMQKLVADRKLGMQLVSVSLTGSRNLYNRVHEVNSMDSMKGLKMRVMNSPIEVKVWSELGMMPTSIPAPEIYSALQSGVVDAAESSISAIVASKYYEVAPNLSLTNHQISVMLYFVSDKALAKVPEEVRADLMATFREAGLVQAQAAVALQEKSLAFLRSRPKVKVIDIDTEPFQKKLLPLQEEVAKKFGMEDVLAMIHETGTEEQ